MKISAVPSVTMPTIDTQSNIQPSSVDNYKKLKMKTNATPLTAQNLAPQDIIDATQTVQDANNQTEATVEATQPLSPQLALLAKQRRALQQERRELENQKKALLAQSSGNTAIDLARLKAEPLKVLLENGVTYQQLTDAIVNGQGESEINTLKAEVKALKQELMQGIDQRFTEKESSAEKQVLAEMQREASTLIKDDQYELVRETNSVPQVMRLIERTYHETGEVLDVPEALRLVEEELFKDAQKLAKSKKLQSQFSPVAQPMQPQQRQTGMRTLTNRDTASPIMSAKQRAIAAFYGNLKR